MVRTILTHLVAVMTVVCTIWFGGDLSELAKSSPLKAISIVVLLILVLILATIDIVLAVRKRPIRYSGKRKDQKAQEYMAELVKRNRGTCAISSNNLSWVKGEALEAMRDKARARDLVIVMPKENDTSKSLKGDGAKVYYYGGGAFESRFTIVNYGRSGRWAAVSHEVEGVHIIRKIRSAEDPTLHLASDLLELAQRHADSRGQDG